MQRCTITSCGGKCAESGAWFQRIVWTRNHIEDRPALNFRVPLFPALLRPHSNAALLVFPLLGGALVQSLAAGYF
jgi:hypothetical protein